MVGTPGFEPWHFTAHLSDEARYAGLPELDPTLVRWQVPAGAPEHLAISIERLEAARRGETLLIVSEEEAPAPLLERAWDAKKIGATILAMNAGDAELSTVAHDMLVVAATEPVAPVDGLSFDLTQHVVSVAAVARPPSGAHRARDRLARLLDRISGPPARR